MKKIALIICLGLFAPFVHAQDYASEIDFYQAAYGLEKKEIVSNFMNLSGESATAFWTIYEAYENERQALGKERLKVLTDYAEQYESLSNEQADALMKRILAFRMNSEKLYKKYYNKVKKSNDAKIATQFFQLESYLGVAIQYSLLEAIPFVGE